MNTYKIKCCNKEYKIKLIATTYANNGRLAVRMVSLPDGEPFATITVNINYPISNNKAITAFVDTNNCEFLNIEKFLRDNQIAIPTGRYGTSGYCTYPEYIFNLLKF